MYGARRFSFRHVIIDPDPIETRNSICLIADINQEGFNDIVIGNYAPQDAGGGPRRERFLAFRFQERKGP